MKAGTQIRVDLTEMVRPLIGRIALVHVVGQPEPVKVRVDSVDDAGAVVVVVPEGVKE